MSFPATAPSPARSPASWPELPAAKARPREPANPGPPGTPPEVVRTAEGPGVLQRPEPASGAGDAAGVAGPARLFGAQGDRGAGPGGDGSGPGGEQVARQHQCEQPEDEPGHRDLA